MKFSSRGARGSWLVAIASSLLVLFSACSRPPSEQSLKGAFADAVSSVKGVRDFQRKGDELVFTLEGDKSKYTLTITAAKIEPQDDEMKPFKGTVNATFLENGKPARERFILADSRSGLPDEFRTAGVAEDSEAYWGRNTRKWNWIPQEEAMFVTVELEGNQVGDGGECGRLFHALDGEIANTLDEAIGEGRGSCGKSAGDVATCIVKRHAKERNPLDPDQPAYVTAEPMAPCQVLVLAAGKTKIEVRQKPGPTEDERTFNLTVD